MRGQHCRVCATAVGVAVQPTTDVERVGVGACVARNTDTSEHGIIGVDYAASVKEVDIGACVGILGVGRNVVVGAGLVSVVEEGNVGDCMGMITVGYRGGVW